MALEQAPIPLPERVRQARERIETHRTLIDKWTHRRDEGDCVPDAETLTKWIEQEAKELRIQTATLDNLTRSGRPAVADDESS